MTRIKYWLTQKCKKRTDPLNIVSNHVSTFNGAYALSGMAKILDLGATLYSDKFINTTIQNDVEMIESDWSVIGTELTNSINYFKNQSTFGTAETQL